jgi:hypothetical protein
MNRIPSATRQRGASLVVGLIMLTVITVLVLSSYALTSAGNKAVGNMQFRNESLAAANAAIEQVITSPFTDDPTAESINVDLDGNDTVDYTVAFAEPECINVSKVPGSAAPPSSLSLGAAFAIATAAYYLTVWDLNGTVTEAATGASVQVHQGVRVRLTQAQYDAVCA